MPQGTPVSQVTATDLEVLLSWVKFSPCPQEALSLMGPHIVLSAAFFRVKLSVWLKETPSVRGET